MPAHAAMDINLQKMAELVNEIEICACQLVGMEVLVSIVGAHALRDGLVGPVMKIWTNARLKTIPVNSMNV